jgi:hypothetical protein
MAISRSLSPPPPYSAGFEDDVVPPDEEHGVLDAEEGLDDVLGAESLRRRNGQVDNQAPAREPKIHGRPLRQRTLESA